eukprot:UN0603
MRGVRANRTAALRPLCRGRAPSRSLLVVRPPSPRPGASKDRLCYLRLLHASLLRYSGHGLAEAGRVNGVVRPLHLGEYGPSVLFGEGAARQTATRAKCQELVFGEHLIGSRESVERVLPDFLALLHWPSINEVQELLELDVPVRVLVNASPEKSQLLFCEVWVPFHEYFSHLGIAQEAVMVCIQTLKASFNVVQL